MKKLFFITLLFTTARIAVCAQSKGLSEEGYIHWYKAKALMDNIKQESDYFLIIDEFRKVLETDPTYADAYSNMGILWTSMGDFGGGIPCFDSAKVCYDKYLVLRPAERSTTIKILAQLEVKKENFIRNIGFNMILIEGGMVKKDKNIVNIDAFYTQGYLFTLADFKRLITPMAIAVATSLNHDVFFLHSNQKSFTEDNNIPYLSNFYTSEKIVKILSCITGKNYFIPTKSHLDLMVKSKKLGWGGIYFFTSSANAPIREWINDLKITSKKTFCYTHGLKKSGYVLAASDAAIIFDVLQSNPNLTPDMMGYFLATSRVSCPISFRVALPASEK